MSKLNVKGIFPPIATAFIKGKVAYDKLASNVEKWAKTGIRGFVVLGSNGEFVFYLKRKREK
jgi:4-hydroxy-2-oxoglutarate aldolase